MMTSRDTCKAMSSWKKFLNLTVFSGENVLSLSREAHLWGRMALRLALSWAELSWALLPVSLAWI